MPNRTSGARPTFFRACVMESRSLRGGYAHAGYQLAGAAEGLAAEDIDDHDPVFAELRAAVAKDDADAVVAWMQRVLPRCMALVPRRRLPTFTRGVALALEQGRL